MKKILIILMITLSLLITGCSSDEQEQTQQNIENKNFDEIENQTEEKIKEVTNKEVNVDVNDQGSSASISSDDGNVEINKSEEGNVKTKVVSDYDIPEDIGEIETWCIEGETFSTEAEGVEINVIYKGPTEFKENIWCEGYHEQEIEGIGLIKTDYYISEDLKEYYTYSITPFSDEPIENHIVLE